MFRTVYRLPFRLLGIPIHLDFTFLLVLPLLAWFIAQDIPLFIETFDLQADPSALTQGWTPYVLGFLAAIGLFVSVVIHELGHSWVGQRYGLRIKRITLWILGGMAQFERMPRKGAREAVMAIAGPITSFLLAGVAWIFLAMVPIDWSQARFVLIYLMYMNVVLAVFNLIPAMPLDGGRVLRSLLSLRMSYLQATQISTAISKLLAVFMGLVGLLINPWLILIALFIYMAVSGESQFASVSAVLQGISVADLMTEKVSTVYGSTRVSDLIQRMFEDRHLFFPVLDAEGNVQGVVTIDEVRKMKAEGKDEHETAVDEIMSTEVGSIKKDSSAFEAFQQINQTDAGRLVVLDEENRLAGVLSRADLVRAVQLRSVGMEVEDIKEESLA